MKTLFLMSLYGSAMILVIIILRGLFINKLSKRTFKALWILAALRMLIPFFTVFEINIDTAADNIPYQNQIAESIVSETVEEFFAPETEEIHIDNYAAAKTTAAKNIDPEKIFFAVWISGTMILIFIFSALYFFSVRKYRFAGSAYNSHISKIINEFNLNRKVEIKISKENISPFTYGIFRPKIVLPVSIANNGSRQMEYIIFHELTHIKNNDFFCKLLVVTAVCVNWFNPFAWVMFFLSNRDIELSCDEEVMLRCGAEREEYALTLIEFKEKQSRVSFSNAFGKNSITERIEAIMKFKKSTAAALAVSAGIILSAAAVLVLAPEFKKAEKETPDITAENNTGIVENSDTAPANQLSGNNTGVIMHSDAVPADQLSENNTGTVMHLYAVPAYQPAGNKTGVAVGVEVHSDENSDEKVPAGSGYKRTYLIEGKYGHSFLISDNEVLKVSYDKDGNVAMEAKYRKEPGTVSGGKYFEGDYETGFTQKWEVVTYENGVKLVLPPRTGFWGIKHVSDNNFLDGEDAVKALEEYFSGEESFTYPIDTMYNSLYHYDGGFYITAAKGENIYSMLDGKVIYADMGFPFGNAVIIEHSNGNIFLYAHCNDLCVSFGDEVKAGDVIGHVGSTGDAADNMLYIYKYRQS